MFKITYEIVQEVMTKALKEIKKNPIHFKWLLEYNLNLAFSSSVSFIVAKDYDTVLDSADFQYLLSHVCEAYINYIGV